VVCEMHFSIADIAITRYLSLLFPLAGMQKEAFYQELISKSGHGRLASQEHSGIPRMDQARTGDSVQDLGESSLEGPVNRRYSFQPLRTPTSASAIDEAVEQSRLDSPGIVNLNHESTQSETERTRRPEPEAKTSEDEMVTLQDFIEGTEQELVTVQDFFKNELGRTK
jgi:predicted component of type VI protein secretion system